MRTIVLFLLASMPIAQQQSTYKPVATNSQLMRAIIVPASDMIWNIDDPPKDDKEWIHVENSALLLAEGGNLLMMEGRAPDKGEWMKQSRALVDAGAAAFKAAEAKDMDALLVSGDQILAACDGCHKTYFNAAGEK